MGSDLGGGCGRAGSSAIGAVYGPEIERLSHLLHASIRSQCDAVVHFDELRGATRSISREWEQAEQSLR